MAGGTTRQIETGFAGVRDEQRQALEQIFTGQAGGIPGVLWTLASKRSPTRVLPIEFGKDRRRRWVHIGDVLDVEIEGIEGREPGTESWIDNVRHPVSSRLGAARATRMTYRDHGFAWNNTGRNGHYSTFIREAASHDRYSSSAPLWMPRTAFGWHLWLIVTKCLLDGQLRDAREGFQAPTRTGGGNGRWQPRRKSAS
jgi:Protein of unknown function (DUF1326)